MLLDPKKETLQSPRWDTLLDPTLHCKAHTGVSCPISPSASDKGSGNLQRQNKEMRLPPACSGHMRPRTLSKARLPLRLQLEWPGPSDRRNPEPGRKLWSGPEGVGGRKVDAESQRG